MSDMLFNRAVMQRGRVVLAMDGMLGGAQWASCPAG